MPSAWTLSRAIYRAALAHHLLRTEMKNVLFGAITVACLFTLSWALVGVMLAINFTLSLTVSLASFLTGLWASGQVEE